MTKNYHTPAPWEAEKNRGSPYDAYTVRNRDGSHVADLHDVDTDDLRVILAAPDLLYALEQLTEKINFKELKLNARKDFSLLNAHAYACKIIRKARGEA